VNAESRCSPSRRGELVWLVLLHQVTGCGQQRQPGAGDPLGKLGAGGRHADLLVRRQQHHRALEIGDLGQTFQQLVHDEATRSRMLGDAGLEVAAARAQPIDLVAHSTQRGVVRASVAAAGHRVRVRPARQMLAQRGGGLLELGAEILHSSMMIGAPAEALRRTLRTVLRLTGLPAPARYPRATVRRAQERLEIVFSGDEDATRVDVDLRLLGRIDDLEAVVLDLLAKLKAQGYDARLDRRAP
jgi:hypothetical protein